MSTKEHEKSSGKPRQRSRKPKQRGRKADQKPDQGDEDQIGAMVASTDAFTNALATPSELPSNGTSTALIGEAAPTDTSSIGDVRKADQQQRPMPNQRDEDQIGAMVASTDALTNPVAPPSEIPSSGTSSALVGDVARNVPSIGDVAPTENRPISIRTIAKAYGTYTDKSFQETSSFVEKLMGVRSFDKVIDVQTDFARQAHATFVAESQKICELYAELARQTFRSWQGFALKVTQAGRQ